ncbi:MAG: S9 family peptidase [Gemmatimonadetes bacterium]|nr:S9 family peptidase [Gemmatimonadota bacterium]
MFVFTPQDRVPQGSPLVRAAIALIVALLATGSLQAVGAQEGDTATSSPRPLTVDDQFAIQRVGSPVVSPDGEWVAYTVSKTSLKEEKSETRIWMASTSGGDPIPMTAKGAPAGSPKWSPDGKYLSFTASRGEGAKSQVWVLDRRGGEARQLTDVKDGVSGFEWSPDGTKLLLSIRDPDPDAPDSASRGSGAQSRTRKPWVIDRLQFKRDGQGYLTGSRHTHLYVFDVETKELIQITSGRWDEGSPVWSPDGTRVAFVSNRTEEPDGNSNSDIWVVAAANTDKGATLIQVTTNHGSDGQPAWSPDGRSIVYVTVIQPELIWYATNNLAVVSADGEGAPRLLTTELDRNVRSPRFTEDGRSIYFLLEDSGENHLARIDVSGRNLQRPISGPLSVRSYHMGPGGMITTMIGRTDLPGEIFRVEGGGLEQVTHVNDDFLAGIRLGEVRNVQFPSLDGTEIEGFIHFPPGFQEGMRYPTILRIHGGPVSQYSHSFNFEAHLFAANGYLVVTTNPRGSSGYGQAFSHALWADWGNKDYEDVMAGVDYAIEEGWADPDRLGVGGWSYGGILTDHVITRTDRFKAAITGASEVLYVANYGHDHYQQQWERELGLPWETREVWERISPFNRVASIVTPTLIMGGEQDWNVPIQNSEQLYQALRRLGIETQLVVYPGQSHGLRVPSYQKDRYERYLAWYDKYVK